MEASSTRRRAAHRGAVGLCLLGWLSGSCAMNRPQPPLPVAPFPEAIVVSAWTEPSRLPPGGGDAQILVRVKRKNGTLAQGVEVRLRCSSGTLYSQGKVLLTDARGMTRDRITTETAARITVNAGGTLYTLPVELGPKP